MGMLDGVISEVGSRFGIGDKARQLVGYLLSYMTSSGVGGLGGFLSKLKNMGLGSILGNSSATLSGSQVNSLFGGSAIDSIASRLGLPESTVTSAAGMAVPAMLAKLAPGGTVPATLPAEVTDLTRQFALPSLGSVAGAAGSAATSAWSWLTWLLPLIGLARLAVYLMKSCQKESPTTQTNPTPPPVTVTLPRVDVPELGKVEGDVRGLFTSLTDTAKAALPKLAELETKIDAAKATIDRLPAAGRETIRGLATAETGKLQVILDKTKAIGGAVWDTIKPVIDRLIEKFKALGA